MLQNFYPSERINSVYEISFEHYFEKGYRGIIFDIDNTLVPHGAPSVKKAEQLFSHLRQLGFSTCLLSNNQEPRVKPFADTVGSPYICNAHKPSVKNYRRAMENMKTNLETTLFIGDQIFTDIYGANRTGIHTILVAPIHPKEEIQIVLKRYLERIVLFFYERKKK